MHKLLSFSILLIALIVHMVSAIPILKGVEPRYRRSANPEEMIGEYGSSDNTKMNIDKNMFIRNNFVRITEIADVDNTDEFILLE